MMVLLSGLLWIIAILCKFDVLLGVLFQSAGLFLSKLLLLQLR